MIMKKWRRQRGRSTSLYTLPGKNPTRGALLLLLLFSYKREGKGERLDGENGRGMHARGVAFYFLRERGGTATK